MLFITGCTTNHLDNVMISSNAVQVGDSWSPLDSIERAGVIHCETIFYKGIMPSETGFRFSSGL